jgi:hypothetical protein
MVFCPAVNIAADIRESERNASARVAIAELFSLAHGQAADVLAISWLLCALRSQIILVIARRTLRC